MTTGKNFFAAGVDAPIGRLKRRAVTERLIVEPISLNGPGRTNDEMPTRVCTMRVAPERERSVDTVFCRSQEEPGVINKLVEMSISAIL